MPPAVRRSAHHAARRSHPTRMPGPAFARPASRGHQRNGFFSMVPGVIAKRLPLAPGTATTGGITVPPSDHGDPRDAGAAVHARRRAWTVGAAFMPPAIRLPHQCRGGIHAARRSPFGIHAARDAHPAPMPAPAFTAFAVAVRNTRRPARARDATPGRHAGARDCTTDLTATGASRHLPMKG